MKHERVCIRFVESNPAAAGPAAHLADFIIVAAILSTRFETRIATKVSAGVGQAATRVGSPPIGIYGKAKFSA